MCSTFLFYVLVARGNQSSWSGSQQSGAGTGGSRSQQQAVVRVECTQKQSIYGYAGDQLLPFLKLTLSTPRVMASCKRVLEQGFTFSGTRTRTCDSQRSYSSVMCSICIVVYSYIHIPPYTV